jgi:hypothetical protein
MNGRTALTVLLAATLLAGVGCSTTVIDPGTDSTATYRWGKLKTQEPAGITEVYAAAEKAMGDLGLSITQKTKDKLEANIIARDAQDKKIKVELLAVNKDTTEITVVVSSVEKAQRIYQTIHENLTM